MATEVQMQKYEDNTGTMMWCGSVFFTELQIRETQTIFSSDVEPIRLLNDYAPELWTSVIFLNTAVTL